MWEEQSSAQPADVRVAESTTSSNDANDTPKPKIPPTACLSCRAARQKCDRKQPWFVNLISTFHCSMPKQLALNPTQFSLHVPEFHLRVSFKIQSGEEKGKYKVSDCSSLLPESSTENSSASQTQSRNC